jgi:two-component system, OmpR family, phosphate regulon sensor histidine kinase PhoR
VITASQILWLNGLLLLGLLIVLSAEELRTWFLRSEAKKIRHALAVIIRRIQKSAEHPDDVRMLCEQLLFVAERAGEVPLSEHRIVPVDLAQVCKQVVAALAPVAKQARVQLAAHTPKATLLVAGDPLLLRSAFEEILRNAIHFSSPKSRVEFTIVQMKFGATVTIADSGHGVAPHDLRNLGKLFYRAAGHSPETTSAGVGLAAARHFIRACRGEMTIDSTVKKGTVVTIKLNKPVRTGRAS